jgi:hypothetical protein
VSAEVRIDCICPPKADGSVRHPDGDTVRLSDALGFRDTMAIRKEVGVQGQDHKLSDGEVLAILHEGYVLGGVESWSCQEDGPNGKPVAIPVTKGTIQRHLLTHYEAAIAVADAADDLYAEEVWGPLLRAASTISPATSEDASTPPTKPGSTPPDPMPSKPSLTSITPTDSIEATSDAPDGVSKPSRRTRSAA